MDEGTKIQNGIYSIFDTGSSNIMLSVLWYESFVEQLFESMGGTEYSIQDGVTTATCAADYPDLYFLLNKNWLQIRKEDYVSDNGANVCSLNIRPVDAPFNILGMPAYIGYYISHDWEKGTMSLAPHGDSSNVALQKASRLPTQELKIKYQSENTPNGDVWAFAIAAFVSFAAVGVWGYAIYFTWSEGGTFTSDAEAVGYAAGGFFAIFIFFFVFRWILLLFLMPGNVVEEVPDAGEAAQKVNATHMSILGLLSYFFYKLCGKKSEMRQKKAAKKEAKTDEVSEIDEFINTIE